MTARLLLLAAALPLAGLAQLELTQYDPATNTETPIDSSLGLAAVCQTLQSPEIRLRNIGLPGDLITVTTLEPLNGVIELYEYPLPSFTVEGQEFRTFYINFTPPSLGTFNATLTAVGSDAEQTYTLNVALTGTGVAAPTVTDSTGKSYCPGDTITFPPSQVGTPVQITLTIANPTANAVTATVAEVTPTAGGTDFGPATPVDIAAGASQPVTLTFTPSTSDPDSETGTLTVNGLVYNLAGNGFLPPPVLLQPTVQLSANANQSSNQAQVTIPLAAAATSTASGQLTLTFQPAGNLADDPNILFTATSTRVISVLVNPGDTAVQFQAGYPTLAKFQTGTTAGTISFTLSIGGVTATASTTIAAAPVTLDLQTAVPATDEIIISLAGFDNTHAASSLTFTFYNTTGQAIAPGLIQANVTTAFANYYQANPQAAGTFNLQATFPVTGDITQVATVNVQFTNPAGTTTASSIAVQ